MLDAQWGSMGARDVSTRKTWDLGLVAVLLAIVLVGSAFIPEERVLLGIPWLNFALFELLRPILSFWLLLRLWVLARRENGPATLVMTSLVLAVAWQVYADFLYYEVVGTTAHRPVHLTATLALVVSGLALAVACVRWALMPRWLTGILVAQAVVLLIEVGIEIAAPTLWQDELISHVLWIVWLVGLAAVSLTGRWRSVLPTSAESSALGI